MVYRNIAEIKLNPNNPRTIKDEKFLRLVKSIQGFPEMLDKRPIVCNSDMVVLGGNMRLKACKEAGLKQVPVEVVDWDEEKQREFIIKDNSSYGEWAWQDLQSNWDAAELAEWGLDISNNWNKDSEENAPSGYAEMPAFFLNIRCHDEKDCQSLYEKFLAEGLDVKIVT